MGAALFLMAFIVLLIVYTILVLFCMSLQNTLKEVDAHNREVEPGKVWLNLIPLFNIVWPFILNPKISRSIKNQLEENGAGESGDYGLALGRTYPILQVAQIVIPIEAIDSLLSIATLVVFIIFWVKIHGYRSKISASRRVGAGYSAVNNKADLLD